MTASISIRSLFTYLVPLYSRGCLLCRKRDIKTVARYLHWLAKDLGARFRNFLHGLLNIIHTNYDGGVLRRHIRRFSVKTTVDGSWVLRSTVLVGLGGGNEHIVVHIGSEHLRLPAECFCVKISDAVFVLRRNFKVDYWILSFPPYRLNCVSRTASDPL